MWVSRKWLAAAIQKGVGSYTCAHKISVYVHFYNYMLVEFEHGKGVQCILYQVFVFECGRLNKQLFVVDVLFIFSFMFFFGVLFYFLF